MPYGSSEAVWGLEDEVKGLKKLLRQLLKKVSNTTQGKTIPISDIEIEHIKQKIKGD